MTAALHRMRVPARAGLRFRFLVLALVSIPVVVHGLPAKDWTVMVYMMADNDLEESAIADLREMEAAASGGAYNLVVLADRGSQYTAAGIEGIPGWEGAKLLVGGPGRFRVAADWGISDLGSGAALERFVSEAASSFPARRYALIFWDHGGAWTGYGMDESADSHLELAEIEAALASALPGAGIASLDLIGFDACLMAGFEVMSRFTRFASYYLASEELEPSHGWDYRSLSILGSKPGSSALELATAIADGYMRQAEAERNEAIATLSLVDLGRFRTLEKAVADFAAAAQKDIAALAPGLGRSAGTSLAFGKAGRPEQDTNMVDIGAFVTEAARENPSLSSRRDAVLAALKAAVPVHRKGSLLKDSTGISIYFPNKRKHYKPEYEEQGNAAWKGLLVAYYGSGSEAPQSATPRFEAEENLGEVEFDEDGVYLGGILAPEGRAGVVDASFYYGVVEEDLTIFLGDDEAYFDPETGEVIGAWDGTVLTLTQGRRHTYGYLSLSESEEGTYLFSIPFVYFKSGNLDSEDYDFAYVDLVVDDQMSILSATLFKESEEGMLSELRPAKGSKLVPLVEVVTAEGESSMEMTEDWGFDARDWESIELDFECIDPRTMIYLELSTTDAEDEGDFLYFEGEWP